MSRKATLGSEVGWSVGADLKGVSGGIGSATTLSYGDQDVTFCL